MTTETIYKINIDDRNYSSWSIYDSSTLCKIDFPINPSESKLFTNDVFTYDGTYVNIIHSTIRQTDNIPATLILAGNKTYGRKKKLLYKCIPDDKRIPVFLVPYEMKNVGFSKVFINTYVTIKYSEWTDKHPYATLTNTIGPVDSLDCFYEYQLYCKSLNVSIQRFTKDANAALNGLEHDEFIQKVFQKYPIAEDRTTSYNIYTIDPKCSTDYDDGFSIKELNSNQYLLSIYIANVTILLDALNLWSSFSRRIATIYLPDRKRPMLPTILSDCLCSLQENHYRFAFVLDLIVDKDDGTIISTSYKNALIKVKKNYRYEEPALLENEEYKIILELTRQMVRKQPYITNVKTSHDLICYLMILMNYHSAKELITFKNGIFRSSIVKKELQIPEGLPEEVNRFIKIWNSSTCQYLDLSSETEIRHDMLDLEAYIHITSPIRRLVDLLNIIKFQQNKNMITLTQNALDFYNRWLNELNYINTTMRAIRKVQTDCNLLDLCVNNPDTLDKLYDGYCFDKLERNDGLFQFIIYIPELRLATRITLRDNLENYEIRKYKLYIFNDEDRFKKKIRLQIM
jgi:exoribonuclease R